MHVECSRLPKSRVLLNVEVDADRVERAFSRAYKSIGKKTNVPGFRKGKVPKKILERILGREVILEEAKNLLLLEAYPEAIKQAELFPLGEPDLNVKKFEEGIPMVFTAEVDIKPVLSVPDYKALEIEIEQEKFNVKDTYIEESLNIFKSQLAETKEVSDRGLQKGDFVDLSLQITYADKPEETHGDQKRCFVNEDNFAPSMLKEIEGMKVEETREFSITDAEDKKINYAVTLNSLVEFVLPELTDDFIAKNTKFNTLEEVKEEFRKEWERILLEKKKTYKKESIIDKLLEEVEKINGFEVPETLLAAKINSLMNTHMLQLSRSHLSLDDYLKETGSTQEDYMEKLKEEAVRAIKTDLLLDTIANSEDIKVSEEDFKKAVDKLRLSAEKTLKSIDRKDLDEYILVQLRKQRVLDFLLETIPVKEN